MIAIYARVSTALQALEGTSLDAQIELCKKRAYELGAYDSNIRVYREEGYSGEDIDIRPEMTRLRQDVANGLVSHVICIHPDRLSRDMTDKLIVVREFEKYGAEIVFTDTDFNRSPEGILFFNIISAIAAYELALIKKRTVRGRERAVKEGKKIMPMRVAPFGYDKDEEGQLVVNKEEARYVRLMYEWYVYENLTMREIGERLYKLGVMPKRGESKNWNASSIGRVLKSEIYIGNYYYNRRHFTKVKGQVTPSGAPRRMGEMRDEEDWIKVEIPAIVDIGIYELAQKQKEKNTKNRHVGNQKFEYLLKSILKCGHCGRTWDATTYSGRENKETGNRERYRCYRCPNRAPKKYGPEVEKCPSQSLRAELLEDYIWNQVTEIVANPERLVEHIRSQSGDAFEEIKSRMGILEKQVEQKEKEKEKIKTMYRREVISEDEMVQDIAKLNKEIKSLQDEIGTYRIQIEHQLKEEQTLERIYEMTGYIKEKMDQQDELFYDFKRHIVEMLFDEIIIRFDGDEVLITSIGPFDRMQQKNESDVRLHTQRQKVRKHGRG